MQVSMWSHEHVHVQKIYIYLLQITPHNLSNTKNMVQAKMAHMVN